jgi:pyridoxal/pyridoxine/pyridoxamine kinase
LFLLLQIRHGKSAKGANRFILATLKNRSPPVVTVVLGNVPIFLENTTTSTATVTAVDTVVVVTRLSEYGNSNDNDVLVGSGKVESNASVVVVVVVVAIKGRSIG